jgi:YVTN family beta-propeller protein
VNAGSDFVTVIDGNTNGTTQVPVDADARAVAVNAVTNRTYVAGVTTNRVTVIDGATDDTTTVPVGNGPVAIAVNPVTNKIYVANYRGNNVTVIDGATNDTTTVPAVTKPFAIAVNPVTNKIYVASGEGGAVLLVIDGASNGTTVLAAVRGCAVATNPVRNDVYAANGTGNNVFAIQDAPVSDTKVRLALTGKAVNRWFPSRTRMMGVLNRVGSVRLPWQWADVTGGAGTDSLTWSYNWGADSLVWGENFVCFAPLEDQAATTGNLGLGTPFAGNPEVYAVYRVFSHPGIEEAMNDERGVMSVGPSIVRGVLFLPKMGTVPSGTVPVFGPSLLDINGRRVLELHQGANDVSRLSPGVYFVREAQAQAHAQAIHKVVVTR